MRGLRAALAASQLLLLAAGGIVGPAGAAVPGTRSAALHRALDKGMRAAGRHSGAYVVDLNTGSALYASRARYGRLPASVEKLYTTSTALADFGPAGRLTTAILGLGTQSGSTFRGTLYLHGGGDPTFGSAGFDARAYGAGATVQDLVRSLIQTTGIQRVQGRVVADGSRFDARRGTPATSFAASTDVEGALSALSFNRDWADPTGATFFAHPALEAGRQLVRALGAAGVRIPRAMSVSAGPAPAGATVLAQVSSPTMAALAALTNTPSDNYFAETLLKDLGASFGTGGSTAAGAAVVRDRLRASFGIRPRLNDGSGLSRYDRTSPIQVVDLLRPLAHDPSFTRSLAVAGQTGTLKHEMRGTYAQGRCSGKTGTLADVSNLAGYCRARDGHILAFAFLMNGIYPDYAHPIQNAMVIALARYRG